MLAHNRHALVKLASDLEYCEEDAAHQGQPLANNLHAVQVLGPLLH